jgi:murein L,D-transpeptidase YcbB/YkuD
LKGWQMRNVRNGVLSVRFPAVFETRHAVFGILGGVGSVILLAASLGSPPANAQSDRDPPAFVLPLPPDVEAITARSLTPEALAPKHMEAAAHPETRESADPDVAILVPLPPDITGEIAAGLLAEASPPESPQQQIAAQSPPMPDIALDLPALPEVVVTFETPADNRIEAARLDTDSERLRAMVEPLRLRYRLTPHQAEALVAAYAERDFRGFWLERQGETIRIGGKAGPLVAALVKAEEDGLDAARLLSALPMQRKGDIPPASAAETDLRFSLAAYLYAHDARGGRLEPSRLSNLLTPHLSLPAPGEVLARLAMAPGAEIDNLLQSYQPPHAGYRALRKALAKLREDMAAPILTGSIAGMGDAPLPMGDLPPKWLEGAPLVFGKPDPRVAHLRLRLGLAANGGGVYDDETREAVIRFQRANDLTPNGRITPKTRAALENPRAPRTEADRKPDRQAQLSALLANMERWRWLPAELGETHVFVNVADFSLNLVANRAVVHETRVIVGKPQTQTPVFSDEIEHLIVNPSWHVPPSILKKEFLPALAKDPEYAAKRGYEVVRRGNAISIRQPPGEKNALGYVKFIFPNQHAVYLHDTPNRNLFTAETRAFSHGCVRVDRPFAFAEKLLQADLGLTEPQLRAMVGRGERMLKLNRKIPVHLAYFTVTADENGEIRQRRDIYGHDARIADALQL